MKQKNQNIFPGLRRMFTGIAAGALALIWWGVLYPELCFPQDTYDIICEEEGEIPADESYCRLLWADEEQIVIKSRLWEWIEQHKHQ